MFKKNTYLNKHEWSQLMNSYKVLSDKLTNVINYKFSKVKKECKDIKSFLLESLLQNSKFCKKISNIFKYIGNKISSSIRPTIDKATVMFSTRLQSLKNVGNLKSNIIHLSVPVAAVAIMCGTIVYWNNLEYGLALAYQGEEIATIQDEKTFEEANQMVNQKLVVESDKDSDFAITPKYKLVISNSKYDSSTDVRDKLLEQSKDVIEEATGLYVDDKLIGAVTDGSQVDGMLDNMLKEKVTGDNQEANFVQRVETVSGLYSKKSVLGFDDLKNTVLNPVISEEFYEVQEGDVPGTIAEACDMNLEELEVLNPEGLEELMYPGKKVRIQNKKLLINVAVVSVETYEKEIEFETVKTEDNTKYEGTSETTQEGENGMNRCVDKIYYVDGKEVSRESLSIERTKEPVNKTVLVGTKKKVQYSPAATSYTNYTQGSGKSTGSLGWPVPYTRAVSSGYGPRWGDFHTGIDITSGGVYGQSIVAADGGVVTAAVHSGSGYGNYVIIDHGNGISTLYAHASSLSVSTGMRVSKGQVIAAVGSTGNSTGPHCHFEVRVGGSHVNPLAYL